MPKVFIAIPNMGWIASGLVENLIYWLKNFETMVWMPVGLRPIPFARNSCVEKFIGGDRDFLWFIDADTTPPKDALPLFLDNPVPAISGVVKTLKLDDDGATKSVGMVLRRNHEGYKAAYGEGMERIDAAGFGCMFIQRKVFDMIPLPWFEERPWGNVRGSDFLFCEKLEEKKVPLYAHFDVKCKHRKEVEL